MLPIERRKRIREVLLSQGSATFKELSEQLSVSLSTVYRDAQALETEGLLQVRHGSVNLSPSLFESGHTTQMQTMPDVNLQALEQIATAALSHIEEIDSIFIGESLVCNLLAQKIAQQPRFKQITIVTNNFNVAITLSQQTNYIYLIGGELLQNAENLYTGGPKIVNNLNTIFVNKAFCSVDGIDTQAGYTMYELSQLNILSNLKTFASTAIFLAESTRFGYRSIHKLEDLDFADILITDGGITEAMLNEYGYFEKPKLMVAK